MVFGGSVCVRQCLPAVGENILSHVPFGHILLATYWFSIKQKAKSGHGTNEWHTSGYNMYSHTDCVALNDCRSMPILRIDKTIVCLFECCVCFIFFFYLCSLFLFTHYIHWWDRRVHKPKTRGQNSTGRTIASGTISNVCVSQRTRA